MNYFLRLILQCLVALLLLAAPLRAQSTLPVTVYEFNEPGSYPVPFDLTPCSEGHSPRLRVAGKRFSFDPPIDRRDVDLVQGVVFRLNVQAKDPHECSAHFVRIVAPRLKFQSAVLDTQGAWVDVIPDRAGQALLEHEDVRRANTLERDDDDAEQPGGAWLRGPDGRYRFRFNLKRGQLDNESQLKVRTRHASLSGHDRVVAKTTPPSASAGFAEVDELDGSATPTQGFDASNTPTWVFVESGSAAEVNVTLPEGVYHCPKNASGSSTIKLRRGDLRQDAELFFTQAAPDQKACQAALDMRKTRRHHLILQRPFIEDDFVLDWQEGDTTLTVYVKKDGLLNDSLVLVTQPQLSFEVPGVGEWQPGCPLGARPCQYRVSSVPEISTRKYLTLTPVFANGPNKGARFLNANGSVFVGSPIRVSRWLAADLTVDLEDNEALANHLRIEGALKGNLARFASSGTRSCKEKANGSPEHSFDVGMSAAGRPYVSMRKREVPQTDQCVAKLKGADFPDIKPVTIDGATRDDFQLTLTISQCMYTLRQLTHAYAGLTGAQVLYSLSSTGPANTCNSKNWLVEAAVGGSASGAGLARRHASKGNAIAAPGAPELLEVKFDRVLSASTAASIPLTFKYPENGAQVRVTMPVDVRVEELPLRPTDASLTVQIPEGSEYAAHRVDGLTKLAVAGPAGRGPINLVGLDGLRPESDWLVEIIGGRSFYQPCQPTTDFPSNRLPVSGQQVENNRGRVCVRAIAPGNVALSFRATHWVNAWENALGMDRDVIPKDLKISAGWIDIPTSFTSGYFRLATKLYDLVTLRCGNRTLKGSDYPTPAAVKFGDFGSCFVDIRLEAGAPQQAMTRARAQASLKAFLDHYGEQRITVTGAKLGVNGPSTDQPLLNLAVTERSATDLCDYDHDASCPKDAVLRYRVNLERVGAGAKIDKYQRVMLKVAHNTAAGGYVSDADSSPESMMQATVRRGPQFASWDENGHGVRLFGTLTAVSLFRYPHSGTKATSSQDVKGFESAEFAAGLLMVVEPWDFDLNQGLLVPWLNPQFQFGVVTAPVNASGSPSLSVVYGLGLRSGLSTAPDDAVEAAAKFLVWGETRFWDGRNNPSQSLLIGLGADFVSLLN